MAKKAKVYTGTEWVDLAAATTDLSEYPNMTTTPISGFRNAVINGGFNVHQRGGTINAGVSSGIYSLDRWFGYVTGGMFSMQQSSDIPTGYGLTNSFLATCTTADATIDAGDFNSIEQRIEGYQAAALGFGDANTNLSLSFWVKSSLTGIYCVSLRNNALNRSFVSEYTINTANTWERKTIQLTSESTGTWEKTNGIGIRLDFSLSMGSNFRTATPNTWISTSATATANQVNWLSSNSSRTFQLAGVQLERGSIATPFEQRPIGTEISLCQRYYYKSPYIVSPYILFNTGNVMSGSYQFPVRMRVAPSTITYYDGANTVNRISIANAGGTAQNNITPPNSLNIFTDSWQFGAGGMGGTTGNNGNIMLSSYEANAEL